MTTLRPFYQLIVILTATLAGDSQVGIIVGFEQTSYDAVEGEEVNICVEVISPPDIGSTEIYVEVISVETTAESQATPDTDDPLFGVYNMDPGADYPPPFTGLGHLQDIPLTQSDRSRCFNQRTYADELVENDEYFRLGIVLDTTRMNSPLLAIDSTRGTTDVRIVGSGTIMCPALENPTNGNLVLSGNTFGETADYTCNTGFILVGDSTLTCGGDGQWSGSPPVCNREAQVQCYRSVGCPDADAIAQYPTALECCMMDEALSYNSGLESCIACVAYGWKDPLPLEVNKGDVLTLNVGFIKGSSPGRILFELEFDDEEVEANDTRVVLGGGDAQVILKVLDDGQVLLTDKIISVFLTKTAGGTSNDILVSEATLIIRAAKVNVGFNETAITVKESSGKATVCLSANSINAIEVTVAIESTPGGTATERDDSQLPSLVTLKMSANSTACVDVALIVHDGYEGPDPETYSLLLTTTNSSVNIVQSTITISILDTDMATIVLEPEREVVTEGDEQVKQVCLQITNSAIEVGVSFPDALLRDVELVGGTEVLLSANESVTCVKYTVKDDDEFEGTEEITVTWRGQEPHLETGVKPATFTLVIEDNEQLGIRLVDGPNAKSGLVEVLRSDWRSVCDDYWKEENANVVCRQLGFLGYGATTIRRGSFERTDLVQYWLDDVHCKGDESTLFDCRHRGWGRHNCRRNERAGVNCLDKSDIDIRLVNDSDEEQTGSGTIVVSSAIELELKGEWRSLCCNHWTVNDAQVACRELGFFSDGATTTAVKAEEGIKHWLDYVNCEGDEESLFACDHTSIDGDECNKGLRAGVTCPGPL